MPGAFAPIGRAPILTPRGAGTVAAIASPRARTAYEAGLSHFPDAPGARPRIGFLPLLASAETGLQLYQSFAGGGSQTDQQRQARAQYFGQLALQGNVNATQILIGGTQNTSGNEIPYWQGWLDQLRASSDGQQTLAAAQQRGAWWPVGSTDTVTNYPIMKAYAAQGTTASQFVSNLVSGGAQMATGAITRAGVNPWLIGAAVIGGALYLTRRRR